MKIGVPNEVHTGEKRVATTPEVIKFLQKLGYTVAVESGAGAKANFSDEAYRQSGAEIINNTKSLWESSNIILKVRAPELHPDLNIDECDLLKEGQTLISFIWPAQNESLIQKLAEKNINVLAMDSSPRISRAQKMDAVSSMANISG